MTHPFRIWLLCLATLAATTAVAQNADIDNSHQAIQIVNDYYRMLNLQARRNDSVLYIESRIVRRGGHDTLFMRRWIGAGLRFRIEFSAADTLQRGLFSDGRHYFEDYDPDNGGWRSVNTNHYHNAVDRFDYRGPLYQWQMHGYDLIYEGSATFEGVPVERVGARNPDQYDRHYYFERDSRLLFLYTENDSIGGTPATLQPLNRVDWHAYHEYQPLGGMLLPSAESYQYDGSITLIFHQSRYVAADERLFTQRKRP